VLDEILKFFLAVFDTLRVQVGIVFTQQTVSTFLEILAGENLAQILNRKDEVGATVMTSLLEILTLVTSIPGGTFESLLPAVVSFSMEQVLLS
jgi:hypothetical protein